MRIAVFLTLLVFGSLISPIVLLLAGVVYIWWWKGYELLILAFFWDAFFGSASLLPYFTIVTGMLLLVVEWIKPQLAFFRD